MFKYFYSENKFDAKFSVNFNIKLGFRDKSIFTRFRDKIKFH